MAVRRGMALSELLLACALFSVVVAISYSFLSQAVTLSKNVSGAETALLAMKRAQRRLEKDVLATGLDRLRQARTPASLGGGAPDGDAVWFLSTEGGTRKPDGSAFWQRNVLYYLVVPPGCACAGGAGPGGLDDRCPHKALLRKVIDSGTVTSPSTDPATSEEQLLTSVSGYLTRPGADLNLADMASEPGLESVEVVAADMLWFEVKAAPDPRLPRELQLDLRAVSIELARKEVSLGTAPLAESRYTLRQLFSVYPRN